MAKLSNNQKQGIYTRLRINTLEIYTAILVTYVLYILPRSIEALGLLTLAILCLIASLMYRDHLVEKLIRNGRTK